MNTLGKILVFLILIVSVFVVAGIAVVYTTSDNWQKGYGRKEQERSKLELNNLALVEDKKKLEKVKDTELAQLKNELKDMGEQRDLAVKEKDKARTDLEGEKKEHATTRATIQKFQAMVENRENEVKILDEKLALNIKRVEELLVSSKKLAERAVTAEVAYESSKVRVDNLMTQYQELLKQFESYRVGDAAKTQSLARNPPPEDLKGSIKATDATSGMVTINLGSDSGLNKGNTLEVYRLKPTPQYVGVVRIMDVRPNEAVGKLILRRGQVQVGDEVASEILSKR